MDPINEFFGRLGLENEEIIRQIDRTLAASIISIEKNLGLKKTLIVLAADHGMADMPWL